MVFTLSSLGFWDDFDARMKAFDDRMKAHKDDIKNSVERVSANTVVRMNETASHVIKIFGFLYNASSVWRLATI